MATNSKKMSSAGTRIPDTLLIVDYWEACNLPPCCHYFLTHMHADHTVGLNSSWRHTIHCTYTTARLAMVKFELDIDKFCILEYNEPKLFHTHHPNDQPVTVTVTAIDANHCPGSAMFYFEGYFGKILYTGDFRLSREMLCHPKLQVSPDVVYIDNTYCHPACLFPTRDEVMQQIIELVSQARRDGVSVVYVGVPWIGKEEICEQLALINDECVAASRDYYSKLQCIPHENVYTRVYDAASFAVTSFFSITPNNLDRYNSECPTLAILPTARFIGPNAPPAPVHSMIRVVPYSDHCSYNELMLFVKHLKPHVVRPILREGGRADMSCFDDLLSTDPPIQYTIPESVARLLPQLRNKPLPISQCPPPTPSSRTPTAYLPKQFCRPRPKGVVYLPEDNLDSSRLSNSPPPLPSTKPVSRVLLPHNKQIRPISPPLKQVRTVSQPPPKLPNPVSQPLKPTNPVSPLPKQVDPDISKPVPTLQVDPAVPMSAADLVSSSKHATSSDMSPSKQIHAEPVSGSEEPVQPVLNSSHTKQSSPLRRCASPSIHTGPSRRRASPSTLTGPAKKQASPSTHTSPAKKQASPSTHTGPSRRRASPSTHTSPPKKQANPSTHTSPAKKQANPSTHTDHSSSPVQQSTSPTSRCSSPHNKRLCLRPRKEPLKFVSQKNKTKTARVAPVASRLRKSPRKPVTAQPHKRVEPETALPHKRVEPVTAQPHKQVEPVTVSPHKPVSASEPIDLTANTVRLYHNAMEDDSQDFEASQAIKRYLAIQSILGKAASSKSPKKGSPMKRNTSSSRKQVNLILTPIVPTTKPARLVVPSRRPVQTSQSSSETVVTQPFARMVAKALHELDQSDDDDVEPHVCSIPYHVIQSYRKNLDID